MLADIPATASVGHTVLTATFTQILDICTTKPEVTLFGDTDLFEAVVDSCQTVTIRTSSVLPSDSSVRKFMVKARFLSGVNVIMDSIFVTVTIQRTGGNVVVVLPDMTFSDHLVTSVAPGASLSLSNSDYMTIGPDGAVHTSQQLSVDAISSDSVEAAVPLPTSIQRRDGTSTTTTSLTAVVLKTEIKTKLPEDSNENHIVTSFMLLRQSSLNAIITSNINNNIFAFDGTVLKVQNARQLDYDNGQRSFSFTMVVTITMDTEVTTIPVSVEVEVLPTNDNIPNFVTASGLNTTEYSFSIFPTPLSTVVCGAVRASDADPGSQLTYILVPQSGITSFFAVGEKDGIVTTRAKTDDIPFTNDTNVSSAQYMTFSVQVQDENILHTVTAAVTVNLRRTPERNLGFVFNETISEDAVLQTTVATVARPGYINYEFASRSGTTDFFALNPTTGVVSVGRSLDRETQDNYKFSITANEEQTTTCALVVMGDLTITVSDVNDNKPMFERTSYSGTVEEEKSPNTVVKMDYPIKATDKDTGGFTYRISQENTFFTISQSGEIRTLQTLNREQKSVYNVEVTADDGVNTNQVIVTVIIEDINDNDPAFSSPSYSFSIQEEITTDNLGVVVATDADVDDNADLSYLIDGGGDEIVIGYKTGIISVPVAVDREETSVYNMIVTAVDGGDPPRSSTVPVTVSIIDINDNKPVFAPSSLLITTDEEVPCTNTIGQLSASDRDATDSLRYRTSDQRFVVDANTGAVRCNGRLDYEAQQQLNMEVIAEDTGTNPLQTTATAIVTLRDINDHSPIMSHPDSASLQQNDFSTIKPVIVVDVEDEDSGMNGEVTFALAGSNLLTIDDNGIIRTVQSVPAPDAGTYTATVTATDRGTQPRTSTSTVTIQVIADTTINLRFRQQYHTFTVLENLGDNTVVGDVGQSLDNPLGLTAKYDIPNPIGSFSVNINTGVITTNSLDREEKDIYVVVVRVREDGSNNMAGDLTLVNVTVADTNDHSPVFPIDKYRVVVEENKALGTVITDVSVTDADVGVNADIYFALYNSENSVCWQDFTINEGTGELSVVKTLDFETYHACKFTVRAFDRSPSPRTSSIEVDVVITDVNDNSPTFSETSYLIHVAENFRTETNAFGSVSDADSNENGKIQLSTSGTTTCPFKIKTDTTSLIMTLGGQIDLDYETETSYTCVIVATDMATNPRTSSATVNVNITDVNDNSPVFDSLSYEVNISRDLSPGVNVINVMATDADSGLNKRIQYILTGDEGYLNINPNTGQVSVDKSLYDYRLDVMVTTVTAIDQLPGASNRLSSSVTLVINIEDANVRPNFPTLIVYPKLREETEVTGVFYTAEANDWDGTTNRKCTCTYRLEDPSENVFEINSETGEVSMVDGTSLDRERDGPYYSVGIIARDQGSPPKDSETLVLNITVLDINDQSPRFRYSNIPTFSTYQTVPSGSSVGTVTADDRDSPDYSRTSYNVTDLFFSTSATFSDRNTSVFGPSTITIEPNTGTLRTTRSLQLVRQTTTFYIMLTVEAMDLDDTSMRDTTPVIIEVKYEDPNQHYPIFSQAVYQEDLDRSHPLGEVVLRVTATDADTAPLNAIRYSITAGNHRDVMAIDPVTGDIKLSYLIDEKFDSSNLTLTVRASDSGELPKYSICTVMIILSGEYVPCVSEAVKQEIVAEKDLFFAVMIALVGALCIAIVVCFVLFYKYRTADKLLDVYNPSRKDKENNPTYQGLNSIDGRNAHEYTSNEGFTRNPSSNNGNNTLSSFRSDTYDTIPTQEAIMNPAFRLTASEEDVSVNISY